MYTATHLVDQQDGKARLVRVDGLPRDSLRAGARLPDRVLGGGRDLDGLNGGREAEREEGGLEHCVVYVLRERGA